MAHARYDPVTHKRIGFVDPERRQKIEATLRQKAYADKANEARDDLLAFTEFTMPDPAAIEDASRTTYEAARYHRLIANHLEEVERGDIRQIILCMPARHGKSELATRRFAAWYSGRHPNHDVIVAAAGDELAQDMGADTRAIMQSPRFRQVFPNHRLRRGGSAKDNIQTTQGGRLVFAGVGGQINGRGAHLLLMDDLIRNDKDARSQTIRDDIWNWMMRVALKRRMGAKLTMLIMTRWHSDDPIGRLTDPTNDHFDPQEAATWKIIRLPGLAEEDDPLGRAPGEALWPERFDREYHLADQRRDPLGFEALVQQNPSVADGSLFLRDNLRFYKEGEEPADLRIYCASDHAVGLTQRNDPSCLLKVGVDRFQNIYLLECDWRRIAADVAVEAMLTMASGERKPIFWWAERGHITKSIGPFLRKRMQETGRYINLREVTPIGDKQQRAQSIAARVATGKVFFPRGAPWTERAINEMLMFPNGQHDDFVDALAYIGLGLPSVFGAAPPAQRAEPPKFGTLGWVKLHDKWFEDQRRGAGGF